MLERDIDVDDETVSLDRILRVVEMARRPTKVAAIALANKLARMAWAMMATGERYNYPAALRV